MPVGAIVGGIATVGGAAISSNAAKKQGQAVQNAASESNATNLQIYNQQRQDLMPWMTTGTAALSRIEGLLGLAQPGGQQPGAAAPTTQGGGVVANQGVGGGGWGDPNGDRSLKYAGQDGRSLGGVATGQSALVGTGQVGSGQQTSANALAQPAGQYDSFYNSPGYQFRLTEGQRQLNTGLASRGQLFSGDAGREAIQYGQNFASNEFNTHLNQLFNAAGMGQTSTGQSNAAGANYAQGVNQNNMTSANALASSYGTQANSWQNALGTVGGIGMKYWG